MSLIEITKWNDKRNGLELDVELEKNMLAEEAQEFADGLKMFIDDENLFKLEAMVEMIDAYCDFNFVYAGTIAKMIGGSTWIDEEKRMTYMNTFIIEGLFAHGVQIFSGDGKSVIDEATQFVIDANQAKPIKKTKGKVTKGKDWVDPKELILDLLVDRGWNDDASAVKAEREAKKNASNSGGTLEEFNAMYGGEDDE